MTDHLRKLSELTRAPIKPIVHADDCGWHDGQYPQPCTCGAEPAPPPPEAAGTAREDAREYRRRTGVELDNHHNALTCPYCNPKGYVLVDAIQLARLRERAEQATPLPSDAARLALLVAEKVREMDEAADTARSWTQPGACGIGPDFPCRHERCIKNAGNYAAYWTQVAARCAITLESLLRASASAAPESTGTLSSADRLKLASLYALRFCEVTGLDPATQNPQWFLERALLRAEGRSLVLDDYERQWPAAPEPTGEER